MKLIREYEEKFGYDPMAEFEYAIGTQAVIDLLIEADGKEITMEWDKDRIDYAEVNIQ
jgi:hypothetical protein